MFKTIVNNNYYRFNNKINIMSANTIQQYLVELQKLTDTNLSILKTINESFFTKNDYLTVQLEDSQYIIPSYISLENKINTLQENFQNLVNSPKTGEAYFDLNGNTQQIVVQGFNNTPAASTFASLYNISNSQFQVENNDILKDFLTPNPYLQFDLSDISDDITSVVIRKVVPRNEELKTTFASYIESGATAARVLEADIRKIVDDYTKGTDYVMYDSIVKLPVRKGSGNALYVIEEVVSDTIDDNLVEHVVLKLRNNIDNSIYTNTLTYKKFDELIETPLQVGDKIVTYSENCMMEIESLDSKNNTIGVKVLNESYMNLAGSTTDDVNKISDISKLKFYQSIDADSYKKVKVSLEEDQYVFIAIAPLNDRLNTQASFGEGLVINSFDLKLADTDIKFKDFYDANVRNVGDILYEISTMLSDTFSTLNNEQIAEYQAITPSLGTSDVEVIQINKHLDNSTTVQNIRSLYSQKKQTQAELSEVQEKIQSINDTITNTNFDDTTNIRSTLAGQLTEYNARRNDLVSTLTNIVNQISIEANNSVVPIENAKYRIRGFVPYSKSGVENKIKGVDIQYRYKNIDQTHGTANSIGDDFIFSDWNALVNPLRPRLLSIDTETGDRTYTLEVNNDAVNEPSFNQIDIPITQGETVDIRVRYIYDFGYPFVKFTSAWSDILNVGFPEEYLKDVQILDIIEENNNDIETNRFQNIIDSQGITSHINDKVVDQDITYFHKPESIASGFYTSERRVIPLRDKLSEIDANIISLMDEVRGTAADDISVAIQNGDIVFNLFTNQDNMISVAAYDSLTAKSGRILDGTYVKDNTTGKVSTILNIILSNPTNHVIKLYSLAPGNDEIILNNARSYKFDLRDYYGSLNGSAFDEGSDYGVHTVSPDNETPHLQTMNQFIAFRTKDRYLTENSISNTGRPSYFYKIDGSSIYEDDYVLAGDASHVVLPGSDQGAAMYPYINSLHGLSIGNAQNEKEGRMTQNSMYVQIAPGQSITIPIMFEYNMNSMTDNNIKPYMKAMSFDLRTSLYQDPITYTFIVTANKKPTAQDTLQQANRDTQRMVIYQPTVNK